ncbi:NAD(P)/FAD-dependent oxidoreductase [Pantoea phytobeneficialis]|uniref:FAD-binding oxidoreductase n=1 Tax=Pantoea phytobeneficialis TaxID=2052056 RepID=A0AAP9H5K1_9GAMM|nr:FAD-binding oxidoreductase [Pantoea phytobeneficialis]MDO6409493.1 FAD-binding oxidoreductase [Pantoea phytobeneficialis]QGR07140.1 FAD-dependent oxidoreductase [Pantoea phytobeneficialis]
MSDQAIFTEDFKTTPYWWEAAPPETCRDPLPAETEIAIVGSGFAGLNAAIELARHGKKVVVLEANELGSGGSTRTGGMISSGQKLVVGGAIKGIPPELFQRMIADSIASFAFIQDLVREEQLDADLFIGGRYFGAHTQKQLAGLYQMGDILHRVTGVTVHKIDRATQAPIIGSDFYHGGILVDEYGGVHPGKYNRALRDLARKLGAQLFSHARVTGVETEGGSKVIYTERGTLRARQVIFLTNGYTDAQASPNLAKRIVPVKSYQIATEPLPPELMAKLIPGGRMITDSRRDLIYTRPSPDGTRLLFGSRPGIMDCDDKTAAIRIRQRMLAIWPELAPYRISHAWSGYVGMTWDKTAYAGEMDNARFAVGCNGNGVALMSWLGYRAAQKLLGTEPRPLSFERNTFKPIPLYAGKPWFLPLVTGWYRFRDAVDKARD